MVKQFTLLLLFIFILFGFTKSTFVANTAFVSTGEDSVFNGYPIPKDDHMLFYIQKSFNQNTVVYCMNHNEKGQIDANNPVNVFWRRYQEDGRKRDLTQIEKTFGYGVKAKPLKTKPNTYIFSIAAIKDKQFIVTQTDDLKPHVITTIDNKTAVIKRVFIKAEHIKLLPKVFYVEVFGNDIKTKKPVYERIYP